jgi:hypothetical protein
MYDEALAPYPYRTPLSFFHLDWFVELIAGKRACDAGCHRGDSMVQMAKYASSVCGIERSKRLVAVVKERGLDVVRGSYYDSIPKADVYHCWPRTEEDLMGLIASGTKTLVFQSPGEWNRDASLWDVQPSDFACRPQMKKSALKMLEDKLGGTLEFHPYYFTEPSSDKPEEFPPLGWRQAFVFRAKERRNDPKVLLIVGQHRSGTSMLAGSMGIAGGRVADYSPDPDAHNEHGYFETKVLTKLNNEVMKVLFGAPWFVQEGPPEHPTERHEFYNRAAPVFKRIKKLISSYLADLGRDEFLILKDPRISFMLPPYMQMLWSLGVKPGVVFSDRPDEEIRKSLCKRDGMDAEAVRRHIGATRKAVKDSMADVTWLSTFDAMEYNAGRVLEFLSRRLDLPIAHGPEVEKKVGAFVDSKLRHHREARNVKVISAYFGPRRTRPSMVEETIEWMNQVVEKEMTVDKGVFADTIIVNHDITSLMDGGQRALDYLASLDGLPTRNGVLRVMNRPWNRGVGGSFGSFNAAFERFGDEYEYWMFTEDNVVQIADGYFAQGIKQLQADDSVAFVGMHRHLSVEVTAQRYPAHAHGGCGCVHRSRLKMVYEKHGCLPHCKEPMKGPIADGVVDFSYQILADNSDWYGMFESGEVAFTNVYVKEGLKIEDINVSHPVTRHRGNVF